MFAENIDLNKVSDAVVNVAARLKEPLNDVLSTTESPNHIAHGSGVIVDAEEGLIVTNAHVIKDPEIIIVTLNDGTKLSAKKMGSDPLTDLALIKITSPHLVAMPFATKAPDVGQNVITVGNPFGLDHTITSGIVSGLHRQLGKLYNMIQTDAPINPGNSGGALVNRQGELLGICTAITTVSGGSIGLGFVIPIETVKPIINQLKIYGNVKRGTFGIIVQTITPSLLKALGISPDMKGVLVSEIMKGSPAERAGIQIEDIITAINEYTVTNPNELKSIISSSRLNDKLAITLYRKSSKMVVNTTLFHYDNETHGNNLLHGAQLLQHETINANGDIQKGLLVLNIQEGSNAFLIGLEKGDLITSVNHVHTTTLASILKAIEQKDSKNILLSVRRDDQNIFLGSS